MILYMTIKKEFFLDILTGEKKTEYRDRTQYWYNRLTSADYDFVLFQNGYAKNAPRLKIELKEVIESDEYFELHLGNIIEVTNCENISQ
jgi:hypothetical protein